MTVGKEKQFFIFRFPLMAAHLMKTSAHGIPAVVADAAFCFTGFLQWRISLAIIKPLNFLREIPIFIAIRKALCKVLFGQYFIEAQKPGNLEKNHQQRFQNDYYLLKRLKVVHLKDCWIYLTAYHGITFKNFKIMPESVHGKWDKRNVTLLKDYHQEVMNAWMYAYHEKNSVITELSGNNNYLLCHHWFNYYHWLTETVLRIWTVKESISDYTLLLPESFRTIGFVGQSLEALGVKSIRYVKEGIVRAPNLALVENKPYCNHYFPDAAKQIGVFFSDYVKRKRIQVQDFGDKIFISRKKAGRRKMINEDDVYRMLSGCGFSSVDFEDFDFFQQVAILGKAKYLVGMHGAGLTNMLFMPQGGRVLEFHREIYSRDDLHSDVYWKLVSALGHSYYYQFCEPLSKEDDFFTVDFKADVAKLKSNLEIFLR